MSHNLEGALFHTHTISGMEGQFVGRAYDGPGPRFGSCFQRNNAHENVVAYTSGVSNIHNNTGTFYMKINVLNTEEYSIIVEEDLHSIPEFPMSSMILLFAVLTATIIICQRKLLKTYRP